MKINYQKFYSDSGMNTKVWGKSLWDFLFLSILGHYPVKINESKEHLILKQQYKNLLESFSFTLPCVYCRNSFVGFLKELPIEKYMTGRIELMYWLYLVKDKVNKKLIVQEKKCFLDEKRKLKEELIKFDKNRKVLNSKVLKKIYKTKLEKLKNKIKYTKPSPSFYSVLKKYEKCRAKCDAKTKSCRK